MSKYHHDRDRRGHNGYAPTCIAILLACALAPAVCAVLPQLTTAYFHRFDRQTPTHPYYMPDMSAPRGHLPLVADSPPLDRTLHLQQDLVGPIVRLTTPVMAPEETASTSTEMRYLFGPYDYTWTSRTNHENLLEAQGSAANSTHRPLHYGQNDDPFKMTY